MALGFCYRTLGHGSPGTCGASGASNPASWDKAPARGPGRCSAVPGPAGAAAAELAPGGGCGDRVGSEPSAGDQAQRGATLSGFGLAKQRLT